MRQRHNVSIFTYPLPDGAAVFPVLQTMEAKMATHAHDAGQGAMKTIRGRKLSVVRLAVTGGVAAVIFFALCWVATYLPIGVPTHMYIQLFTSAQISSTTALFQGALSSVVFGAVAGSLIAAIYNLTAAFDRH